MALRESMPGMAQAAIWETTVIPAEISMIRLPTIPADARELVILVHESNRSDVDEILDRYPDALSIEVERPAGRRALTVIALYSDPELAATVLAACKQNAES